VIPIKTFFPELASKPTFVLTGDQDWAPDWALAAMLSLAETEGVPLHLFVTNKSPSMAQPPAEDLTLGIHPNFLPNSTHGASDDAVIDSCQALVPGATSFRCHAFCENTHIIRKLVARGFIADSNLLAFLQPGLVPIVHGAGLLRFPVFLEDDVFLHWARSDLDVSHATCFLCTPGIKILNFHPSLVALNAPSFAYYEARREMLASGADARAERFEGRGVETILRSLIAAARQAGYEFTSFPALVDAAYNEVPGDLYPWPGRPTVQ
jgi:hypothetical protein